MSLFSYTPTDTEKKCAEEFANNSDYSYYYENRNQTCIPNMIQQNYRGKLAEYATYHYFQNLPNEKFYTTQPDLKIQEPWEKSFDADLRSKKYLIHVKSIASSAAKKFGKSWLFQKGDKITSNPKSNDLLVLCVVNGSSNIIIEYIVKAKLVTDLWKDPKAESLRSTKVALYLDDLISWEKNKHH